MQIHTYTAKLYTEKRIKKTPYHLRGYIIKNYPDAPIIQFIDGRKGAFYTYPLVQFKIINGYPIILGIKDAVDSVKDIVERIDSLKFGPMEIKIKDREISENECEFGISEEVKKYNFISPWLPLREDNYTEFKYFYESERSVFLRRTLVRNIFTISKTLEYKINTKIKVIPNLKTIPRYEIKAPTTGFLGSFRVNFHIPNYFGLGNSVAKGFGTVKPALPEDMEFKELERNYNHANTSSNRQYNYTNPYPGAKNTNRYH
ncbi:MAG: CRISPR-associated endonuclease Cas6 [Fidelibacterota bacterium]